MEKKDGLVGGGIYRPERMPFAKQCQRFVFNKDTGAFFGRTPLSWIKILTFYIIFYFCLACFFALLMLVVWYTLDPRIPKYQLEGSLIGTSPGLGFRPMPTEMNALSTLIWYKGTQKSDYEYWTNSIESFLSDYKKPGETAGRGANIYKCSYDDPAPDGKVCDVNIRNWHPCNWENNYGYHKQQPCIFIKLNRIFGWTPEFYEVDDLPEMMPESLKNHISNITKIETLGRPENIMKTVWVSCEGETPADVENLGPIDYLGVNTIWGFPYYYFPYKNDEGYLSPLVAIVLKKPRNGILINIECKAWAKNIEFSRKERTGSVHFEIMID